MPTTMPLPTRQRPASTHTNASHRAAGRGTTRHIKNSHMFNAGSSGTTGVFAGNNTVTRTKASPTLFVTMVPPGCSLGLVSDLFKDEPGFLAFRTVRRLVFVDFKDQKSATNAMRKLQNHKLRPEDRTGIAIDYDKDARSKRNRNFEQVNKAHLEKDRREKTLRRYSCALCGCTALKLAELRQLESLPKRKTDGSSVVDEAKLLRDLRLCRGEAKRIKRNKGVERQFRLNCTECSAPIAYRPVPLDEPTKYLYVLPDALVEGRGKNPAVPQQSGAVDSGTTGL